MEREQMEAFLAVAETKSFTRAAEMLHVAQSTITVRIKMLEAYTGKSLFTRDPRGIELTSAGMVLYPYVQRVMDLIREGIQATKMPQQFEDRLVIGSLSSMWHFYLMPVVQAFRHAHPRTSLRLVTGHSEDIVKKLSDGLVDVGLVFLPPQQADVEVVPLFTDSVRLVGPPDFQHQTVLTPQDVLNESFLHVNWGSPFTEWYEHEFGKHNLQALQLDDTLLFVKFLLAGEGIGFLLDFVSQEYIKKGQLKEISFQPQSSIPKRTTYLIYQKRKRQSSALQKWLAHLEQWKRAIL